MMTRHTVHWGTIENRVIHLNILTKQILLKNILSI